MLLVPFTTAHAGKSVRGQGDDLGEPPVPDDPSDPDGDDGSGSDDPSTQDGDPDDYDKWNPILTLLIQFYLSKGRI
jgi:hypothetical protein